MRNRSTKRKELPGSMTSEERILRNVRRVTATLCAAGVIEQVCPPDGRWLAPGKKPIVTKVHQVSALMLTAPHGIAEC
jgi:hypothetical protein